MYKGKIAMDGTPEEVYSRVEELEKMRRKLESQQ